MTYADAKDRLAARSAAAMGADLDLQSVTIAHMSPEDFARRMLGDIVPLEELEDLMRGLENKTHNTLGLLLQAGTYDQVWGALFGAIVQELALGLLMAGSERP